MTELAQQVASGLSSGSIYAALALALVLIHRATAVVNFAQREIATFTTFVAWSLIVSHGVPYWLGFALTLLIAFVGGALLQRTVIRPVEKAPVLTVVIVTLGLFLVLNGLATWIWRSEVRAFPADRPFPTRTIDVAGVAISIQDIGIVAVVLAAVGLLYAFFRFTKVGLAMRAAALYPESSRLVGVRVGWMLALGWGLAAALGALAGLLTAASIPPLDPTMMQPILIYAFAAAVLGGMDSPLGAVVGGLVLGVALNLVGAYVEPLADLRLPVAFAIILGILLVRPAGIFGRAAVERV